MSAFLELSPEGSINPEIKQRILTIPAYVWMIVLIFGLLLAFQAILISHRIAGPTFRLRRAIREITDGKYQQNLTLRRYDCLKELAAGLAQLGLLLHSRRESLLAEITGLRTALDAHRQRLAQSGEVASLQADIDPMLRRVQNVEQIAQGIPEGSAESALGSSSIVTVTSKSPGPAA
jgi:nitrate/nitrite-specific signal transduction histidine kinase